MRYGKVAYGWRFWWLWGCCVFLAVGLGSCAGEVEDSSAGGGKFFAVSSLEKALLPSSFWQDLGEVSSLESSSAGLESLPKRAKAGAEAGLFSECVAAPHRLEGRGYRVGRVKDGDTVVLKGLKGAIRLIGINTPERTEPYYREAREGLERFLGKREVYLEYGKQRRDRRGRWLGYLWIRRGGRYVLVNALMVRFGMAVSFPFGKDRRYQSLLDNLERKARREKRGIWGIRYNWEQNKVRHKRSWKNYFTKAAYRKAEHYSLALERERMVFYKPKRLLGPYRLLKVYDGDTVLVEGRDGERSKVRLLGIDTPEKGVPFALRAKLFLKKILGRRSLYMEFDKQRLDKYKRTLAYLFVKVGKRWLFINAQMIRSGFAQCYFVSPNHHYKRLFTELQRLAQKERLGKWSISKEVVREKYYIASKSSFHRPSCPNVRYISRKNRRIYSTREEALRAGKTPARCCLP